MKISGRTPESSKEVAATQRSQRTEANGIEEGRKKSFILPRHPIPSLAQLSDEMNPFSHQSRRTPAAHPPQQTPPDPTPCATPVFAAEEAAVVTNGRPSYWSCQEAKRPHLPGPEATAPPGPRTPTCSWTKCPLHPWTRRCHAPRELVPLHSPEPSTHRTTVSPDPGPLHTPSSWHPHAHPEIKLFP